jgi:hypothetical protein
MQIFGIVVGLLGIAVAGIALLRARATKSLRQFPLFYSYVFYVFCGSIVLYGVYWVNRGIYPSFYWIYFLVSILVEFSVLVEISDHIFVTLPFLRQLGRLITIAISVLLGAIYILPLILYSSKRAPALLGIALRASVTKVIVLAVLFAVSRRYLPKLDKHVAGLMLGFSIYLGVDVANMAASLAYGNSLYSRLLWIMSPIAFTMCLVVWTISLWDCVPLAVAPVASERNTEAVTLQLTRLNSELTKILEK